MIKSKENIGIFFGALAFFIFATSDVIQKYATINHTIFQIIFFRYLFLLIVSFVESKRKQNKFFYKTKKIKIQLSRSIVSVIETVFFVSSFKYLSLTTAHSVASLAPVFVVILSMLILRERIDTHERLASKKTWASHQAIEDYDPDDIAEAFRSQWRSEFIARVLRIVQVELDQISRESEDKDYEKIVEEVSKE